MTTIITADSETLRTLIRDAVAEAVSEQVPGIVKQATAKDWLTKTDVLEMTGWSERTLQYMRQSRQIPFSKHNRKIMYPSDGIQQFLTDHNVLPYGKKKGVQP
jgi:hypothetical protein